MVWATVLSLIGLAALALSQQVPVPSVNIGVGTGSEREQLGAQFKILALLTVLSVAPAILILTTCFTRVVIILSFTRQALGAQNIPPNQVLVGLSLFLTFFIMAPTYNEVNKAAIQPFFQQGSVMPMDEALKNAEEPLKKFMLKNTYESDLKMFLDFRHQTPKSRAEIDFMSVVPAFVISELKTAFVIGFYIFVPFVVIDLVVASLLMGMGMMMMPPVVISLPAKLLVFVLADGWSVLVRAILAGYGT